MRRLNFWLEAHRDFGLSDRDKFIPACLSLIQLIRCRFSHLKPHHFT